MFDVYGNFNSAAEINQKAEALRKEGNKAGLLTLARENGIPEELAEAFYAGEMIYFTEDMMAAVGKIEVEAAEVPQESAEWVSALKQTCFESREMDKAIRRSDKTLKECLEYLQKSLQETPDMTKEEVKKVMYEYYLG